MSGGSNGKRPIVRIDSRSFELRLTQMHRLRRTPDEKARSKTPRLVSRTIWPLGAAAKRSTPRVIAARLGRATAVGLVSPFENRHGAVADAVVKLCQIAVTDRGTLGGLTQFLTQFVFSGSATSP